MPPTQAAPNRAASSKRLTLGRVYCDVMERVGGTALVLGGWFLPNEASAAPTQDTTRRAQQDTNRRVLDSAAKAIQDSVRRTQQQDLPVQRPVQDTTRKAIPGQLPQLQYMQDVAVPNPALPDSASGIAPSSGGGAIPAQAAMESARLRAEQFRSAIYQNEVEIHKKFAISIACIVFVLVGAPIAVRFPRGGVGLVIGFSLVIFAIYYIGLIAGESLADRGIMTPFWAMWAANIILTLVGLLLLSRMGKETATSRGGDIADLLETLKGVLRIRRRRAVEAA
jgi:lipopolysaccharide export system permease protein